LPTAGQARDLVGQLGHVVDGALLAPDLGGRHAIPEGGVRRRGDAPPVLRLEQVLQRRRDCVPGQALRVVGDARCARGSRGLRMFGAQLTQSTGSSTLASIMEAISVSAPVRMSLVAGRPAWYSWATFAATSGIAGPGVNWTVRFSPYRRLNPSVQRRMPSLP